MNKQEQRLEINKCLMLKNKNFLVLHGVSFRLKNGRNILLGGLSGSGKSFIFNKIRNLLLVDELYDEDLIILNNKGILLPLGKKVFKGKIDGKYIYENTIKDNFGKIDLVFYIDNNFFGLKENMFSNENIIKYLVHERYNKCNDLLEIYKEFNLIKGIKSYIIGNDKKNNDFNFLIEKLGI